MDDTEPSTDRTSEKRDPFANDRILDSAALKAMSHPLRVQMYDILTQYGPQTASSLAEQMGESSGSTSYHLRALARLGLIRELEGRGTGRERWWERVPGGVNFGVDDVDSPASREVVRAVTSEFLRRRFARTEAYFLRDAFTEPAIWLESSVMASTAVNVTPEQLLEVVTELADVISRAKVRFQGQEGEGFRHATIQFEGFPLPQLTRKES